MKWIINRSPIFYIFLYFLLSIAFAVGYSFMPNQLYQSDRTYEKYQIDNTSQKDILYEEIISESELLLKRRFLNKFKDSFATRENYSLYSNNIKIENFKFSNNIFTFKLLVKPYKLAQGKDVVIELSFDLDEPLNLNLQWGYTSKSIRYKILTGDEIAAQFAIQLLFYSGLPDTGGSNKGLIHRNADGSVSMDGVTITAGDNNTAFKYADDFTPPSPDSFKMHQYNYRNDTIILSQMTPYMGGDMKFTIYKKIFFEKIYPYQDSLNSSTLFNYVNTFPITENLNNNLKSYALGLSNDPQTLSGKTELFLKMLYFSIATIATLGYGDIVPITTLARSLVSIEVICGIIVIGLFLNSLANKMIKR